MTEINKSFGQEIWDDETNVASIRIDVEAHSLRSEHDEDVLRAVRRIQDAVRDEWQAMQDELDTEGRVNE